MDHQADGTKRGEGGRHCTGRITGRYIGAAFCNVEDVVYFRWMLVFILITLLRDDANSEIKKKCFSVEEF